MPEKDRVIRIEKIKEKVVDQKKDNFVQLNPKEDVDQDIHIENKNPLSTRTVNQVWESYMNSGWIDGKQRPLGPFIGINKAWKNKPCFIVGSGPDLKVFIKDVGFNFLNNKHSIGINHVIESYDGFEWFLFLDRRFLKRTTYDLPEFKGKIFAQNNTGISDKIPNVVRFRCRNNNPSEVIHNGLYSNRFSGLAALNLAIISGASPIYLIGYGMGEDGNENLFHFRENYQGVGQRGKEQFKKYKGVYNFFKRFKRWYPKIIHVTEGESLAGFRKLNFKEFKNKFALKECTGNKKVNVNLGAEPKIAHLSFCGDINKHADITRHIIKDCIGNHNIYPFTNYPKADVYITEHFMSTNKYVQDFPHKNKTINIVHSMNCYPNPGYKHNIALTKVWKRNLEARGVKNVKVIYGGIDLKPYENIKPQDKYLTFGRITRWSPGKIPPWWNNMVADILNHDKTIKCLFFIDMSSRARKLLEHGRMIYDYSCNITDFKGAWLNRLMVYVHANGTFRETMSHAVIEAMATGLPIVYLREPAVTEVVGGAGIACSNKEQLKGAILKLLYYPELRNSYSELSKKRAKDFDINKTVEKFNELIREMA